MRKSLTIFGAILVALASISTAQADDKLIKKGKKVFNKCKACHAIGPDAKNKVGPQLNGIIGRKAASVEGFEYSDPMKAKAAEGLVWDEKTLAEFLTKPKDYVPGTAMLFGGLRKEKDIKRILAFMKDASAK